MLSAVEASLGENLSTNVSQARILVIGAGGIGCELLKNVVLTGFKDIHVVDLDTIDVSNLNRQFLFQRKHVGKSKSQVARESVIAFGKEVDVTAYHDSITNPEYNIDFFKQFTIVMNALDNRAARNHVNRMCLAAEVPLVESGSAGYLGQVTIIKKGITECYECQPKPTQKTFPGCTIRNTPSEPIHCIVWAKHLFNQLFGEADADEEVSPDTEDPELAGDAGKKALENSSNQTSKEIERISTRTWASEVSYDGRKLFDKFFNSDIKYLLSMDKLWKTRKPPNPLTWESCMDMNEVSSSLNRNDLQAGLRDKMHWSIKKCAEIFEETITQLYQELEASGEDLIWDKDDDVALDFVTAAANLRSYLFHIPVKTRFDVKSMAGNIIPAIATTNAIVAGLLVMEALKILSGDVEKCRTVYLNRVPNVRKKLLVPCLLEKPNPNCYVCTTKPEVTVYLNIETTTVKHFEDKILKERLGMVAPDVEIEDGKGTILISSEEGETEENAAKFLSEFQITTGSRLKGDDFLQNYELIINIRHDPCTELDGDCRIEVKVPREKEVDTTNDMQEESDEAATDEKEISHVDSQLVKDENDSRKRKMSDADEKSPKKSKIEVSENEVITL